MEHTKKLFNIEEEEENQQQNTWQSMGEISVVFGFFLLFLSLIYSHSVYVFFFKVVPLKSDLQ